MNVTPHHQRNRTDLLVGDWGSMHLHCLCCPVSLAMINPELKVGEGEGG